MNATIETRGLVDSYRGAVYPWHCDHMGHMNVMWYIGKFDEATWTFFSMSQHQASASLLPPPPLAAPVPSSGLVLLPSEEAFRALYTLGQRLGE